MVAKKNVAKKNVAKKSVAKKSVQREETMLKTKKGVPKDKLWPLKVEDLTKLYKKTFGIKDYSDSVEIKLMVEALSTGKDIDDEEILHIRSKNENDEIGDVALGTNVETAVALLKKKYLHSSDIHRAYTILRTLYNSHGISAVEGVVTIEIWKKIAKLYKVEVPSGAKEDKYITLLFAN